MNLIDLANNYIFGVFLIFCRLGTAMMFFPLFSDSGVLPSVRLLMAVVISLMVYPLVSEILPNINSTPLILTSYIFSEVMLGVFLGLAIKTFTSTLHTVGVAVSTQAGLSLAMLFDPEHAAQNSIPGIFLALLATTMFVALDLDHLLIKGMITSYEKFTPGAFTTNSEYYLTNLVSIASEAITLSLKLSMPFVIGGTLIMLVGGIMARLMPSIQIFFLIIPLQVTFVIILFALSLSYVIVTFVENYRLMLTSLFG